MLNCCLVVHLLLWRVGLNIWLFYWVLCFLILSCQGFLYILDVRLWYIDVLILFDPNVFSRTSYFLNDIFWRQDNFNFKEVKCMFFSIVSAFNVFYLINLCIYQVCVFSPKFLPFTFFIYFLICCVEKDEVHFLMAIQLFQHYLMKILSFPSWYHFWKSIDHICYGWSCKSPILEKFIELCVFAYATTTLSWMQ